jgi:hypothetical protein
MGAVGAGEMAGSPYRKIEQHVDHLTLMNAAARCIGIEFYDIVTARNTWLEILGLGAQSTCANNGHLSRARADPITFVEAFWQMLMAMKA